MCLVHVKLYSFVLRTGQWLGYKIWLTNNKNGWVIGYHYPLRIVDNLYFFENCIHKQIFTPLTNLFLWLIFISWVNYLQYLMNNLKKTNKFGLYFFPLGFYFFLFFNFKCKSIPVPDVTGFLIGAMVNIFWKGQLGRAFFLFKILFLLIW
jgi:hypothetical protein